MGNSLRARQAGRTCTRILVLSPSEMGRMLYKAVGKVQTLASRPVSLALAQLSLQARFLGKEQGHHPGLCCVCQSARQSNCTRWEPCTAQQASKALCQSAHSSFAGDKDSPIFRKAQHCEGCNTTTPAATAARTSGSCLYRQLAGLSPTKRCSILLHTTQRKKIT